MAKEGREDRRAEGVGESSLPGGRGGGRWGPTHRRRRWLQLEEQYYPQDAEGARSRAVFPIGFDFVSDSGGNTIGWDGGGEGGDAVWLCLGPQDRSRWCACVGACGPSR